MICDKHGKVLYPFLWQGFISLLMNKHGSAEFVQVGNKINGNQKKIGPLIG